MILMEGNLNTERLGGNLSCWTDCKEPAFFRSHGLSPCFLVKTKAYGYFWFLLHNAFTVELQKRGKYDFFKQ